MKRPLLILRPQPGADRTAQRAATLGFETLVRPLFAIEPRPWSLPTEPFEAVMLTSANAARDELLRTLTHLPVYAVGSATAAAARILGFRDIRVGNRGVADLVREIRNDCIQTVLHPSGEDVTSFDPRPLHILQRIVYAAVVIEPPPDLSDALARHAVALLHSARAARRLAEIVPDRAALPIAAISSAILDAAGPGWPKAIAADTPDDHALLAAAARLCQ